MKKHSSVSRELKSKIENYNNADENYLQVIVSISDLASELRKNEARKPLYLARYERLFSDSTFVFLIRPARYFQPFRHNSAVHIICI